MQQNRNPLRKAAILVACLDTGSADSLLDQMSPEQAAGVRSAVMDLDDVSPAEERIVIEEFLRMDTTDFSSSQTAGSNDEQLSEPEDAIGADHDSVATRELPASAPPFQCLREAETDTLVLLLGREHPQTIALVLSHLPPPRAADIVARLSANMQVDVLRRVASLDATDPEVIKQVETNVRALVNKTHQEVETPAAGISGVRGILQAAGSVARQEIESNLLALDRKLASRLDDPATRSQRLAAPQEPSSDVLRIARPPEEQRDLQADQLDPLSTTFEQQLSFEELTRMTDHDWQVLVTEADDQTVLVAMAGADSRLVMRIVRRMQSREGRRFRRSLRNLGPVQLEDIRRAQERLVRLATRLILLGRISCPGTVRFAVAA